MNSVLAILSLASTESQVWYLVTNAQVKRSFWSPQGYTIPELHHVGKDLNAYFIQPSHLIGNESGSQLFSQFNWW